MSGYRLAAGGRIDRARPLRFTFDGRAYSGFAGDTLASALLANGVGVVARSFKYHRARGIMSAGVEEPALVQLETGARSTPNLRATEVELYDGLAATSVNAWPSLAFDLGAFASLASPLFVAGFYYKTFMRPKWLWDRVLEPAIRRMAGMGTAPPAPDPDRYDKMHVHCDVLVVGGGPAGLAAALAAARTGARVILCDERPMLGGTLLETRDTLGGAPALDWVAQAEAALRAAPEATVLPRTTAFGYYDHNYLCAIERRTDHLPVAERSPTARHRLWHIRAREVVLATGAHERPLVFAGNDRPGVMLAGAARAYANRFAAAPGRRAVVFANNDSAYGVAADLAAAGVAIAAVVDARPAVRPDLAALVASRGARLHAGSVVVAVDGRRVQGVRVAPLDAAGTGLAGPAQAIDCDLVAMSGGWNPAVHLFSQAQGRLRWDDTLAAFLPGTSPQRNVVAGALAGTFDLAGCLAGGAAAGAAAAARAGFGDGTAPAMPAAESIAEAPPRALWLVPGATRGKAFVDFQNDVTAADIQLAAREGLRSVEHVKRYTTTGMGTDQGKTSNVNALAILSDAVGQRIVDTGTTTFRPPYTPVAYGAMAGADRALSDPVRVTPIHAWHVAHGAVFEDVGQWKRPRFYPRAGEDMDAAVARECRAAREGVAALDASTLGKIDIVGPDAAEFLDRVYTNAWAKLQVGSCRYGLMCKQDGMVLDDGVTTRLAPDRFVMTTTTGNAARVLDWLEEWLQTEWPALRVYCTSVTEQWTTVAVVGPQARAVVAAVAPDLDASAAAFPHMTVRTATIGGVGCRIVRVSFTGELSYEISVPGRYGLALWERVMAAGAARGITPYGTEAMHVLRAEKGYIIVGQETDGTVTPFDLGMGWIVSKTKRDFIGKRSFARADTQRADRKQLVGLLSEDPALVLPEGIQLVAPEHAGAIAARRFPVPMEGHVTSSYRSAALGRSFALALVKRGRARIGETVLAPLLSGAVAPATIAKPVFYDPEDARRDG